MATGYDVSALKSTNASDEIECQQAIKTFVNHDSTSFT